MTTLDAVHYDIPKEFSKAKGNTITRQIVRSGYSLDDRPLSNADIDSLYYNTKKHFIEKGIMVKVKLGHYQEYGLDKDAQKLMGYVSSMSLTEYPSEAGAGKAIWADMFLYEEVYKDYKDGRYPEASISSYMGNPLKDAEGNDIIDIIEHVALLGSERAAIPDLERSTLFAVISNMFKKLRSITNHISKSKKEVMKMDLEKLREYCSLIASTANEMLAMLDESEPAGDASSAGSDDEKSQSSDTTQSSDNKSMSDSQKAADLFNSLVSRGNLLHSNRAAFDSLVNKTNDLAFVESHYSAQKARQLPAQSQPTKSNRDESALEADRQAVRAMCEKLGLDPESKSAVVDSVVKSIKEVK